MSTEQISEQLEWSIPRPPEAGHRRLGVALLSIATALTGTFLLRSPIAGVMGAGIVFASTGELWFDQKFKVGPEFASVKCGLNTTQIEWKNVKSVRPGNGGVLLSPFARPNRLEAFRGVYLRFSGNEETLLAKIAELWNRNEEPLGKRADAGAGGRDDTDARDQDLEVSNGNPSDAGSRDA